MGTKRFGTFRTGFALGFALIFVAARPGFAAETNVPLKPAAWRQVGPGPGAIEAAIAVDAPSGTVYIASLGGGILKSTDGGANFVPVNNGLDDLVVATMAMAPGDPNVVYAGTGVGVYKTTDGGATWSATQAADIPIALVIAPTDANVLYAGYNGSIFKTTDGGATWTSIGDSLGAPQVFSLAVDPRDANVVYAGTTGQGAFQSLDGGATWNPLTIDSTVWSLVVDPDDGDVIYAGSNGNGVFKSTDRGATFVRIGSPEVGVILALARSGSRLYAGTASQGVSVSEDGGATWTNTGISESLGLVLSVDGEGRSTPGPISTASFSFPLIAQPAAISATVTTNGGGWPGNS